MLKINAFALVLISAIASTPIPARAETPGPSCSVSIALKSNIGIDEKLYRSIFQSVPKSVGICPWADGVAVAFGLREEDCATITAPSSIFRQVSPIKPMSQHDRVRMSLECFPMVRSVQINGVHDAYIIRPLHLYSMEYKVDHPDFRGLVLANAIQIVRARTGVRYATLNAGGDWVCVETARGEISPLSLLKSTTLPDANSQYVERKYFDASCGKLVASMFGATYPSK